MPELPEVETTRAGIAPFIEGAAITGVVVRERRLRWPVPADLKRRLMGTAVTHTGRRGKYLLIHTDSGCLILHLGMTGSLCVLRAPRTPEKHDHLDLVFDNGVTLRFHDPRRFGSLHHTRGDPLAHPLLRHLGPEPLERDFSGEYLYLRSRGRRAPVKGFLMDSRIVPGIGNIYASESLHAAGIHPARAAGRIAQPRYGELVAAIRAVLREAIRQGGTTLRDFSAGEGRPGYFRIQLKVYDRDGLPCARCGGTIRRIQQGQRSSWYCPGCQR